MELTAIIMAIVWGIVSGMIAAAIGYAKSTCLEKLDNYKLFQTVLIGAFIGGFAGYNGWDYDTAQQTVFAFQIGGTSAFTLLIDFVCKIVWRRTNGFGTRTKEQAEEDCKSEETPIKIKKKKGTAKDEPEEEAKVEDKDEKKDEEE